MLFDEWQDAPKVWGAVRKSVDDTQKTGQYILTGSTSKDIDVPHTGTMRISRLQMFPMSLFESGESNGTVSIIDLFDNPEGFDGCHSDLDVDGIIHAICRGGWPSAVNIPRASDSLAIASDLFEQTCEVDSSKVDGVKRNPLVMKQLLCSYSRNICQLTDNKTIIADVNAWCPAIRSKTVIRASPKKNLIDPSIAVAALGIGPKYFNGDFKTLGYLFESLCIRDLKIYSSKHGGTVSYYHDRYGLEADAVLHLSDGRYALCEIKLGQKDVDEGAAHLLKIESLIRENNATAKIPIREPDLKIVITGTEYGYRRDDGVFVIPIATMRD